ncbi:hypothetical protein ACQY1Z_04065 [Microcystis aeruginosa FBCC-A68]|uniref:hypothetical protein n=1 Tax=Microcystis aeruginosa TaxID=1126 RepID=UPI003D298E89
MAKLKFSSQVISHGDEEWSQYLESLGITSTTAVKLVTEAALLGSAIEGGVSPELVVLSDGARQFAILVHALCWVPTWNEASVAYPEPRHNIAKTSPKSPQTCGTIIKN